MMTGEETRPEAGEEVRLRVDVCWNWGHSYVATFATEKAAVDFVERKSETCAIQQEGPVPAGWDSLLAVLYPECEHGLSAQLCHGPDHYPPDSYFSYLD